MHWRVETGIRNYLGRVGQDLDVIEAWLMGGRSETNGLEVELAVVILDGFRVDALQRHVAFTHLETGVVVTPYPIPLSEWLDPSRHRHPKLIPAIKAEGIQIADISPGTVEISSKSSGIMRQRASASSPLASLA